MAFARLLSGTLARSIAPGSESSVSRRFNHALAACLRSKVWASRWMILPLFFRKICAVYPVEPSFRLRATIVPIDVPWFVVPVGPVLRRRTQNGTTFAKWYDIVVLVRQKQSRIGKDGPKRAAWKMREVPV